MTPLKNILSILTLATTLFTVSPKQANADVQLNLFPNLPIYRVIMADEDILKTEIKIPLGLEKEILEKPIKELIPYVTLAKTLPLLSLDITSDKIPKIIPDEVIGNARIESFYRENSLSNKIFSTSLIASGLLELSENEQKRDYKAKLELFFGSPAMDDYLSDGNRLYLVGGCMGEGSTNLEDLANKNLPSISKSLTIDTYSFFADAYIVAKSPFSNQFIILRGGVDNLFGNTPKESNFNLSMTLEFPSLFYENKMFENFKISPYISTLFKISRESESNSKILGQFGVKISGESGRSLIAYGQVSCDKQIDNSFVFSTGLKLDL